MKSVKHLREDMNLSLSFVASIIGCDVSNLQKVELDQRDLNLNQRELLYRFQDHMTNAAAMRSVNRPTSEASLEVTLRELQKKFAKSELDLEDEEMLLIQASQEFNIMEQLKDTPLSLKIEDFELKYRQSWIRYRKRYRRHQKVYVRHHLMVAHINLLKEVLGKGNEAGM